MHTFQLILLVLAFLKRVYTPLSAHMFNRYSDDAPTINIGVSPVFPQRTLLNQMLFLQCPKNIEALLMHTCRVLETAWGSPIPNRLLGQLCTFGIFRFNDYLYLLAGLLTAIWHSLKTTKHMYTLAGD